MAPPVPLAHAYFVIAIYGRSAGIVGVYDTLETAKMVARLNHGIVVAAPVVADCTTES